MKKAFLAFLFMLAFLSGSAQNMDVLQADQLRAELAAARHDTSRALVLAKMAEECRSTKPDSSFIFASEAMRLSRLHRYKLGEMRASVILCYCYYYHRGDMRRGLDLGLHALELARELKSPVDQAYAMIRVANIYLFLKENRQALDYLGMARQLTLNSPDSFFHAVTYWRAADAYLGLNMPDSAIISGRKAEDTARQMGNKFIQVGVAPILGKAYGLKGKDSLALYYLRKPAGPIATLFIGEFYKDRGISDSAIYYAEKAFSQASQSKTKQTEFEAAVLLSSLYEQRDVAKALFYNKLAMAKMDSMYGADKVMAAQSVAFQLEERKRELAMAETAWKNKVRTGSILAGLAAVAIIAFIFYRNNRKERKINHLLNAQKEELSRTLDHLKATQAQLVQSEKMASLGELTAGIAHEIQNPLNFVNNFSEINQELIDDLKQAAQQGDMREVSIIADNLKENESKINMHGKRADGIVKSMLQHSRGSSGQKEMADVNRLVDEYVRLAYHGYRAKTKDLNVDLDIDLDPAVGSVSMVRQDIGRVVLNLLNNAFYAANLPSQDPAHKPRVAIRTRRDDQTVTIEVQDNGPGIPSDKKEKIFQPFFTTKPTGQGTGLGLSLSYDVVTKGHGGNLLCESQPGDGALFRVSLPSS